MCSVEYSLWGSMSCNLNAAERDRHFNIFFSSQPWRSQMWTMTVCQPRLITQCANCTALHCTVLYCTVQCTVPGVSSGSGLPSLSFIVKLYQGHDPPFPTTAQRPPSGSPLSELLMFVIPTLSPFCPPSCRRAPLVGPADQALHTPRFWKH